MPSTLHLLRRRLSKDGVEVTIADVSKGTKAQERSKKRTQKIQQDGALDSKRAKLDKAKVTQPLLCAHWHRYRF